MMRVGAKRMIVVQSIRRASRAWAPALAVSAPKPASVRIEWSIATGYHGLDVSGAVEHPGRNTIPCPTGSRGGDCRAPGTTVARIGEPEITIVREPVDALVHSIEPVPEPPVRRSGSARSRDSTAPFDGPAVHGGSEVSELDGPAGQEAVADPLGPRAQPRGGRSENMKHVLITGAAGFIGTGLRKQFAGRYRLRLTDVRTPPALGEDEEFVEVDLRDSGAIQKVVEVVEVVEGVDAVVHLGGIASEGTWEAIRDVNIDGTYNLFRIRSPVRGQAGGLCEQRARGGLLSAQPDNRLRRHRAAGQPLWGDQGVRRGARRALRPQVRPGNDGGSAMPFQSRSTSKQIVRRHNARRASDEVLPKPTGWDGCQVGCAASSTGHRWSLWAPGAGVSIPRGAGEVH